MSGRPEDRAETAEGEAGKARETTHDRAVKAIADADRRYTVAERDAAAGLSAEWAIAAALLANAAASRAVAHELHALRCPPELGIPPMSDHRRRRDAAAAMLTERLGEPELTGGDIERRRRAGTWPPHGRRQ